MFRYCYWNVLLSTSYHLDAYLKINQKQIGMVEHNSVVFIFTHTEVFMGILKLKSQRRYSMRILPFYFVWERQERYFCRQCCCFLWHITYNHKTSPHEIFQLRVSVEGFQFLYSILSEGFNVVRYPGYFFVGNPMVMRYPLHFLHVSCWCHFYPLQNFRCEEPSDASQ